jgi:plastocyanin
MRGLCTIGALALTIGLAACGDDEEEPAAGGAQATQDEAPAATEEATPSGGGLTLDATEDGGLGFDPAELTTSAGEVTITMANPDGNQMPHNVAIEGDGVEEAGEIVQPGGTSEVSATLEAGEYTFYCAVGEHRQNGMEGTLTVE